MILEKTALLAPDFTLTNIDGQRVKLSEYRYDKHVILVFNRGLM